MFFEDNSVYSIFSAIREKKIEKVKEMINAKEYSINQLEDFMYEAVSVSLIPIVDFLIDGPYDFILISKNNGGVLPISRIYQSLWEGSIPIHDRSDMPAWGPIYQLEAYEMNVGDVYFTEIYAESRILLLLEYISRLQEK